MKKNLIASSSPIIFKPHSKLPLYYSTYLRKIRFERIVIKLRNLKGKQKNKDDLILLYHLINLLSYVSLDQSAIKYPDSHQNIQVVAVLDLLQSRQQQAVAQVKMMILGRKGHTLS